MDIKKVNPGDPLNVPADAYNAFVAASLDFLRQGNASGSESRGALSRIPARVRVRNNSGADRSVLDVLMVQNTPPIAPTDAIKQAGFPFSAILDGTAIGSSDTAKPFVVLAEPIKQNAIGWAYAAGIFAARVNVNNSAHTFCNVKSSDSTQLDSAYDGQARILYKQGTGASQLCLIQYPYLPFGSQTSPTTIGSNSEGSETADSTTWTRSSSGSPVDVWKVCRVVYNHSGDKKLYAFVRKFSYDAVGILYAISGETRIEVDAAESC